MISLPLQETRTLKAVSILIHPPQPPRSYKAFLLLAPGLLTFLPRVVPAAAVKLCSGIQLSSKVLVVLVAVEVTVSVSTFFSPSFLTTAGKSRLLRFGCDCAM